MPQMFPALRRRTASLGADRTERKALIPVAFSQYYNDLAVNSMHTPARSWPVERAVTQGYDRVIWCFKSVDTISSDQSRLPYLIKDGEDVVEDHPQLKLLNVRANPLESAQIFRKRLSAQALLSKRGVFVEKTKSNGGTPLRYDLLPPDRTEPIPGADGTIEYFRLTKTNGRGYRELAPEQVIWVRNPHLLDPYSGVTPLESAGLSVELDHFARLYNVSFMQNDGRPGGVLAVRKTDGTTGDMDPRQMDRIESRFRKGPTEAGKLSVIAGDLSYVDLATRPRDMQYGATSKNAKVEVLAAFGVSETVLGYAADRTFANADSELYVYWTITMRQHNDMILAAFDEDTDDNLKGYFDTSMVEVLDRVEKEKRAEAREEFAAGLRSPYSYAKLAGREDEVGDMPETRALYIPTGKTPMPTSEEDAIKMGLREDPNAPAAPAVGGAPGDPAALPEGEDTEDAPGAAPAALGAAPAGPKAIGAGPAGGADEGIDMAAMQGKARLRSVGGEGPKLRVQYRVERKAAAPSPWVESTVDTTIADQVEAEMQAALAALGERWTDRAATRISSPKQRKGTRHWAPEYERDTRVGTKALDADKAVDEQTWEDEAEAALAPIVTSAAVTAAVSLLNDVGVTPPAGETMTSFARRSVNQSIVETIALVRRSAARQARGLVAVVNRADQDGEPIDVILDAVREFARGMAGWARGLATQAATATTNGARDDAAAVAVQPSVDDEGETRTVSEVNRIWFSRRDVKVRPSHAPKTGADGQVRQLTEPFIVGEFLLRYPSDPLAPLRETAGCRCHLRYRFKRSGRWAAKPADADVMANRVTATR